MAEYFQASDGIRLACHVGDYTDPWKPTVPLLMPHAVMGSAKRWFATVPPLSRHFRVVRLDLRDGYRRLAQASMPKRIDRDKFSATTHLLVRPTGLAMYAVRSVDGTP